MDAAGVDGGVTSLVAATGDIGVCWLWLPSESRLLSGPGTYALWVLFGFLFFELWAPFGFLFFDPSGLPFLLRFCILSVSMTKESPSPVLHTFGRPSSGLFGLFFDPSGLPRGLSVVPLPLFLPGIASSVWKDRVSLRVLDNVWQQLQETHGLLLW